LLDDVGRFVRQQPQPVLGAWAVRPVAEEDVLPGGEGRCVYGARQVVGLWIGVHAHARQIGAQAALQAALRLGFERSPAAGGADPCAQVAGGLRRRRSR
jgi:hypothetical protein